MLKKQFVCKSEVDEQERTVTAVISTGAIDRDNEILSPKGADFEQYMKNPVVLWAHDYRDTPIAKALWIKKTWKAIKAKLLFADTPQAEEIYQLFKGGFLNAFSVGFRPTKSHRPDDKEIAKKPELAGVYRIYDEWELLEFSAVPVPANPEALATAVKSHDVTLSKELIADFEELEEEIHIANTEPVKIAKEPVKVKAVGTPVSVISTPVKTILIPKTQMIACPVDLTRDSDQLVEDEMKKRLGKVY